MLHLKKVLGAKPKEHVQAQLATLLTPWGESLDLDHILEEHPTPQFARPAFTTLNGTWDCAFATSGHAPTDNLAAVCEKAAIPPDESFAQQIVVPFSPEAPLSGTNRQLQPAELLWYRRSFNAPAIEPDQRVLLHFQAVDYACAVHVNGELAGSHAGGYTPFAFDITELLSESVNELAVCVADPSEFGGHLRGKQRFDRGDIWYTAQSGIWQTVWLEVVPETRIDEIAVEADAKTGILYVAARICGGSANNLGGELSIEVFDAEDACVASTTSMLEDDSGAVAVFVPDVQLWSPNHPYLYRFKLSFGDDVVDSYCGFRTIEMCADAKGRKRVFLNGEPLFIKGVLDQAYWPDGLMTAPSDKALVYDIEAMRAAGFNLMRKHIKIESDRWYYHCDRLGMLVLQDMISGGDSEIKTWQWSYKPTLFKPSWNHYRDTSESHWKALGAGDAAYREEWTTTCTATIQLLRNHPSIIGWSLFNEGWGQFCAGRACAMARALDPTRFIDAVSGWYDQGCGDFRSVHNYFRDMAVWKDRIKKRAFFISEFGGFTHRVEGHSSLDEAYGYEPYDDMGEWRTAVRALLAEVEALEPRGLAGYVYTQVSDIEEETNGILTYDRRVNKLAE